MSDLIVTGAVRIAAWPIAEAYGPYNYRDRKAFMEGRYDSTGFVQAFAQALARHAAQARLEALEEAAKVAQTAHFTCDSLRDSIEAAIRSLSTRGDQK